MPTADILGIDVLLRIDGHVRSLAEVEAFHQRDPYPGGHRFFLGFQGPEAEQILTGVSLGSFNPPSEDQARRVLAALSMFLQRVPREGVVLLLNTVDELTAERGRVHIAGVCSPIVQRGAA
jgi:hypothetical protein